MEKICIIEAVTPMMQKISEQYYAGFGFAEDKAGFVKNVKQSFISCYSTTRQMYYNLLFLANRTVSTKNMMGPVGIVNSIGTVVEQSPSIMEAIINLLKFSALISINLGYLI